MIIFSDSRDPMTIFADSRHPIFNSRDPNRVLLEGSSCMFSVDDSSAIYPRDFKERCSMLYFRIIIGL